MRLFGGGKYNTKYNYAGIALVLFLSLCPLENQAQVSKFMAEKYSRWWVEASIGVPYLFGNMSSFAADKTYTGLLYGLRAGYQKSPIIGFSVSVNQGKNKMGARDYAADFMLGEDGKTYYLPTPMNTVPYKEIYSDVGFFNVGLHGEVNLINLLGGSSAKTRLAVMVMPGIYIQNFKTTVKRKSSDEAYLPSRSRMNFGMGGELGIRVKATPLFDLQLRSGMVWMSDNNFVGFNTPIRARYNYMWNTVLGVIVKIPTAGRKDNVIYVPKEGVCLWN